MSKHNKFKAQIERRKFERELNKSASTIYFVGVIQDMEYVLNFDAFKVEVEHKIRDNKLKGILFMGDIDNLSTVTHKLGNENANEYIRDIIRKVKNNLVYNHVSEYEIGKLGDELYIYAHNLEEEKAGKILEELNEIKNEELSISVGATGELSHGLEKAISIADERMRSVKETKKINKFKRMPKEDVIENIFNAINAKLRINPNELTGKQLEIYKSNITEAIKKLRESWKFGKQEENDQNRKVENQQIDELDLMRRIKEITKEYKIKYPDIEFTSAEMKQICIAKMLTKTPVKSIKKIESFERKRYKNLIWLRQNRITKLFHKLTKKITMHKLKNTGVLTIDIGNIKRINDSIGHCECDKLVYSVMQNVISELKSNNIKLRDEYLYSKGISNYCILVDTRTSNKSLNQFFDNIRELGNKSVFTINASEVTPLIPRDIPEDCQKMYEHGIV